MRSRTWFLISAMLLLASYWFWTMGNERVAARSGADDGGKSTAPDPRRKDPGATNLSLLTPEALRQARAAARAGGGATSGSAISGGLAVAAARARGLAGENAPYRLRNTSLSAGQLARLDTGLLLANAFLDTRAGVEVVVPDHLRSQGDPGSYIVQAQGPADDAFRARLQAAGARIVSYVPNNAYLVQLDGAVAVALGGAPGVQAVLPFEPYFKLDRELLGEAVERRGDGAERRLAVTVFPGREAAVRAGLELLDGSVLDQSESPFGAFWLVQIPSDRLAAVAVLAGVHHIEPARERALLNDRARVLLGVSSDTIVPDNYLGLTGEGVTVNVNDSGVDATHPDLAGRVSTDDTNSFTLVDFNGHGTHVAATVAGDGSVSGTVKRADGSITNADYRGKAPKAKIYALPIDLATGPLISDRYVQERAARAKAFISNNSWGYPGTRSYGTAAASYDAAVRDALPEDSGSQPLLYVFAAGNDGQGNDDGLGGVPGSILSPATAKNVITVGASEQLRLLTNHTVTNIVTMEGDLMVTNTVTNFFFLAETDSDDQIAGYSARGNVDIGTEGEFGRFKPDVVAPGSFVVSARSAVWRDPTNFSTWQIIKSLNDDLAPHYRYEAGTSMAAPSVAGMLALMQEFFEQRLRRTNSPALMKALLINGARSLHSRYGVDPRALLNYQGWGLVRLTNSLPAGLADTNAESAWPLRILDQNLTNALATSESRTWKFSLDPVAQTEGLRITLVWTDPPGNPVAGLKLVNDLDLIVTNLDSGFVYYGNDIQQGSDFNAARTSSGTEAAPTDFVNNVENVFIRGPLGSNYTVTVLGRRVNVNALSGDTNRVAQDFALVVASSRLDQTNVFTAFEFEPAQLEIPRTLTPVTNGVVLLHQRVGANFPLTNSTVGDPRQWNFYVFTNTFFPENSLITNGTNVAFITFLPPNLGQPRRLDADIDLYVSTNSALTNLDAAAIAGAQKALQRGGNQTIFFTNAPLDTVFYVGVKSEDQQGAEFALAGISSREPFDSTDEFGNVRIRGLPLFAAVPDGSPERPGSIFVIGIGTSPTIVGRVFVTNSITHENLGDLQGNLAHNNRFVVLNNHDAGVPGVTNYIFAYDDSQGGPYFDVFGNLLIASDGPGSLLDFVGEEVAGSWILTMVDNALTHTGRVNTMDIFVQPSQFDETGIAATLQANEIAYYFADVPADATNLTVTVSQMTGPVNVYIRRGARPTLTIYDKAALLTPPVGMLNLTPRDVPPLVGGRYFVAVFNPNPTAVSYRITLKVERNLAIDSDQVFSSDTPPAAITDDARSVSSLVVPIDREMIDVQVGVRLDHPRVADLVLHLVSPQGTRILLTENRGGLSGGGFGTGSLSNLSYFVFSESTLRAPTPIKFAPAPFGSGLTTTQQFLTGFEGVEAREYETGETLDGWTVAAIGAFTNKNTGAVTRDRPAVIASASADTGAQFLSLNGARFVRDIPTTAGRTYYLTFRYWAQSNATINAHLTLNGVADRLITQRPGDWATYSKLFTAVGAATRFEIVSDRFEPGLYLDSFTLSESGAVYYQPEETLKDLQGESSQGRWQLEAWDNRAGPGAVAPEILSWQLQFILAPPRVPTIPLQNGIPYTGVVSGDEIVYFVVDTPRSASFATNRLFSTGDVVLLYSPSGLPTGQFPGDVVVDDVGTNSVEFLLLTTNRPPVLAPGQRYYLGVGNYDRSETNAFTIRVDFDRIDDPLAGLIRLTNGIPYTNTIPVTNALDFYRFDVSPLATNVTFEVFPENGNVDLVIRKALPVPDPLPRPGKFDYQSTNSGTSAEIFVVDELTWPVAIEPGPWILGVYNRDRVPVTYRIVATEILPPITPLTNGIPLLNRVVSSNSVEFFSFRVSPNATEASFKLFGADGNVDLLVRRGPPLPNLTNYHFLSANLSTNDESVVVLTNSMPVALAPGDWYLTVTNLEPRAVTYSIVAAEVVPLGTVPIDSIYVTNGTLCLVWSSTAGAEYVVQGKSTVDAPAWTDASPRIVASGPQTTHCLPLAGAGGYFRVVLVSAGTVGGVPATIDVASLTVVSNQFCLGWSAQVGATYWIEGKAKVDDAAWIQITPAFAATNSVMTYCVPVSAPAQFLRVVQGAAAPGGGSDHRIQAIVFSPGRVTLSWTAAPGLRFQVEFADALGGPWRAAGGPVTSATGDYSLVDDGTATGGLPARRFYRLRVL